MLRRLLIASACAGVAILTPAVAHAESAEPAGTARPTGVSGISSPSVQMDPLGDLLKGLPVGLLGGLLPKGGPLG